MAGATARDRSTSARTLSGMLLACMEREGVALTYPEDGSWRELSYAEFAQAVREIARGLIALGLEPGDKVAVMGETRAEWTLADFGALCAACTVVPVYHTASAEEAQHVLSDSGARLIFCENAEVLDKIHGVWDDTELEYAVVLDGEAEHSISLDELRRRGEEVDEGEVEHRVDAVSGEDIFTIIYTSGTTGPPKGCLLTHANYLEDMAAMEEVVDLPEETVLYVFLPLAHALTRISQMLTIDVGGTIAYWSRDKDKLLDDLKEVRPTHFPAVPRIFEKIYGEVQSRAEGALKSWMLDRAVDLGRKVQDAQRGGDEPGPITGRLHDLVDDKMLSTVRELFGGRLQLALTGAAPVAAQMLEFFYACGVLILEGYGATETSAVVTVNRPDEFRFGTVGKALPRTELKIGEESEILVKGPQVFQGYHGLEEETAEVLDDDGWFHTGDVGELDDDGFLRVTGRMKDIIVTSSGKNITPANIENRLSDHPKIEHAVVFGDDRPYLVALIVPEDQIDEDEVQSLVDEANEEFAKIEQIKKFAIADRQLSQDEGELTPTMKVKRDQVFEHFREQIDALYDEDS